MGEFKAEKLLGGGSRVKLQGEGEPLLPVSSHGAGVRRTFLWAAIGALADLGRAKLGKSVIKSDRPRVLLIEEPESFLHPPLVRAARESLYALSEVPEWQVIATTHSPVFIDVSKPHTTIVRIARGGGAQPRVFSTERAQFTEEERENLRMIRLCHPTVNEFFFANVVWLVEGETEQAVFSELLQRSKDGRAKGVHVVNCMGKANLPVFARILNQFRTPYVVIHDSDSPRIQRNGKWQRSGMWTVNEQLLRVVDAGDKEVSRTLVVHVPNFERYHFGRDLTMDKPWEALCALREAGSSTRSEAERLLGSVDAILDGTHEGFYSTLNELIAKVQQWVRSNNPMPSEAWVLDGDSGVRAHRDVAAASEPDN